MTHTLRTTRRWFLWAALAGILSAPSGVPSAAAPPAAAPPAAVAPVVVPIQWSRFKRPLAWRGNAAAAPRILQNNARHNLQWMANTFMEDTARKLYDVPPKGKADGIRAPASAAYGLAVLLRTGTYGEAVTGVSAAEARRRAAALIKGVAASYGETTAYGKGWGSQWQSALWTALLGQAGCGRPPLNNTKRM